MPESPIKTEEGQAILNRLNSLEAAAKTKDETIATMQNTIQRQHAELLGQTNTPTPELSPETTSDNPQLDTLMKMIRETVQNEVSGVREELDGYSKLIKAATPDAKIWDVEGTALKIKQENPGISGENAMKLAEVQMAAERQEQSELQAQSELAAKRQLALQASTGQRNSTNAIAPNDRSGMTQTEIMQNKWDELGMDNLQAEHNQEMNNSEAWAPPQSTRATVIHND